MRCTRWRTHHLRSDAIFPRASDRASAVARNLSRGSPARESGESSEEAADGGGTAKSFIKIPFIGLPYHDVILICSCFRSFRWLLHEPTWRIPMLTLSILLMRRKRRSISEGSFGFVCGKSSMSFEKIRNTHTSGYQVRNIFCVADHAE